MKTQPRVRVVEINSKQRFDPLHSAVQRLALEVQCTRCFGLSTVQAEKLLKRLEQLTATLPVVIEQGVESEMSESGKVRILS